MQTPTELILVVHMWDEKNYDGRQAGRFEAFVYGKKPQARYEDSPQTSIESYDSPYAHFAITAHYGDPTMAAGRAWGIRWGYRPDDSLVTSRDAERYLKGMKTVGKKYDARCVDNGQPKGLGQTVLYLMRALGIKTACTQIQDSRPGPEFQNWRILHCPADVAYHIEATIEAFLEKHHPDLAA